MRDCCAMDAQDRLRQFVQMNQFRRGGEVAPHKPLLVLYALERMKLDVDRMIPYSEIDKDLKTLLREFSKTKGTPSPQYPFWRLQRDKVWEIEADGELEARKSNKDAKVSELLSKNARGGFPGALFDELRADPSLADEIASAVLAKFPEDERAAVKSAVEKVVADRDSSTLPATESTSRAELNRVLKMERNHVLGMICGYYLSRFDVQAYDSLGHGTQEATHEALGDALGVKMASIQNWRDESKSAHTLPARPGTRSSGKKLKMTQCCILCFGWSRFQGYGKRLFFTNE